MASSPISETLYCKRCSPDAIIPTRGSVLAAGYDLSSCVDMIVPKRGRAKIPIGISIAVPSGTYGRVAPRSGLTINHGIDVGAGVIDEDYRGEVQVILFNHSDQDVEVKKGNKIAQLILERIANAEVAVVDCLPETERGDRGFGSTGV